MYIPELNIVKNERDVKFDESRNRVELLKEEQKNKSERVQNLISLRLDAENITEDE